MALYMSLVFNVKVSPNSCQQRWHLDAHGILKCFLKNVPEKGKANRELIELLHKILAIPKKDIEIISGLTTRQKKVSIQLNITFEQLLTKLGIEQQQLLF
jgi:uncharacterized protein